MGHAWIVTTIKGARRYCRLSIDRYGVTVGYKSKRQTFCVCRQSFLNNGEPSRARTCDPLIKSAVTSTGSGYSFYHLLTFVTGCSRHESICYWLLAPNSRYCGHKMVTRQEFASQRLRFGTPHWPWRPPLNPEAHGITNPIRWIKGEGSATLEVAPPSIVIV